MKRTLIKDRMEHTAELFGINFPMIIEPTVYMFAERLSNDYQGGYWHFYSLDNGGFYMAPEIDVLTVTAENGFQGAMTGDTFGIVTSLYAYSHISFKTNMSEVCSRHFHLLREYALDHEDARQILATID